MVVFSPTSANNRNKRRVSFNYYMMKKTLFILLAILLAGCSDTVIKTITVTNPSDDFREHEAVSLPLSDLHETIDNFSNLILKDEEGNELPYQLVTYPESALLFFATTKAHFSSRYMLVKGEPQAVKSLVHARFVPERKDDFAWENNLAAYRMYGPALAPENPSNGVDLWLKCTDELIVDSFYYREHELHLPYHVNYGKGLDCYKVAHTPGCGGWFPMAGGKPQIGCQYDRWEIVDEGPLSVTFRLYYDHYPLADLDSTKVKATMTITCTAYQQLCKAEVCVTHPEEMELGAGIFMHTATSNPDIPLAGAPQLCVNGGYIAYAENAVSDAGEAQGRNYTAVVMPEMNRCYAEDNTLIAISEEKQSMTYWFGGGWSEWQYPTDSDWFSKVGYNVRLVREPSVITIE